MRATVDLAAVPQLPFPTALIASHETGTVVSIETRPDGLYVGEKKVVLFCSERQTAGVQGPELFAELEGKPVLNANVLHFLIQNPEFIPIGPEWKKQGEGEGDEIMIYFWGTLFGHPNGDHCVAHMEWNGVSWKWSCSSIQNWWMTNQPAALLEA
jgi:hypothetical protein